MNRVKPYAHEDFGSAIGLFNTLVRFFSPAMNSHRQVIYVQYTLYLTRNTHCLYNIEDL